MAEVERQCVNGLRVTSKKLRFKEQGYKDKGERRKEKEIKEGWKV
jgi:hypothetical protein